MGVLRVIRAEQPSVLVTEAHPKVLYFALSGIKHDWSGGHQQMNQWLAGQLGVGSLSITNDHEWDALISAWACAQGALGRWTLDLHAPISGYGPGGTIQQPAGATKYFWPTSVGGSGD